MIFDFLFKQANRVNYGTQYAEDIAFLNENIRYYRENSFEKGSYESAIWLEKYFHKTFYSSFKQGKVDKLAIELISLTMTQDFINNIYKKSNNNRDLGSAIASTISSNRNMAHDIERARYWKSAALQSQKALDEKPRWIKLKLVEKSLEKEYDLFDVLENKWMESASRERLAEMECSSKLSNEEILSEDFFISIAFFQFGAVSSIRPKRNGYYYVVSTSNPRKELKKLGVLEESKSIEKFKTKLEAINGMGNALRREKELYFTLQDEQNRRREEMEQQRQNASNSVDNVRRAMGLTGDNENLDADIF